MNDCENNELNKNENISVKKICLNENDNANINNEMENDLNTNDKSKIKNLKLEKLIKIKVEEEPSIMKPYVKTSPNKYRIINKKIISPNKNYKIYQKNLRVLMNILIKIIIFLMNMNFFMEKILIIIIF